MEYRPRISWLQGALRWTGAGLAALVLFTIFGLYTDPDFMRLMADQVWACF